MKLTVPYALPPLEAKPSRDERRLLKLTPEPEPPLKILPSSTYQFRMESISSSTPRMKQALACCARYDAPILNHTGELKASRCVANMYFNSSRNVTASVSVVK